MTPEQSDAQQPGGTETHDLTPEEFEDNDFRDLSPGLDVVQTVAAPSPSPSPQPQVTQFNYSLSSPVQKKANHRKPLLTQGDWVLKREMAPNQPDIEHQVSQQGLNSDSTTESGGDDDDDMDSHANSRFLAQGLPPVQTNVGQKRSFSSTFDTRHVNERLNQSPSTATGPGSNRAAQSVAPYEPNIAHQVSQRALNPEFGDSDLDEEMKDQQEPYGVPMPPAPRPRYMLLPNFPKSYMSTRHLTNPIIRGATQTTASSLISTTYRVADLRSEHWIDIYINGVRLRAFPDSGSTTNLISAKYALDSDIKVNDHTERAFRLPNGKIVTSLGEVDVLFRFADEEQALSVKFTVLPGCIHDFVLSGPFLWATQTFTKLKDRVYSMPTSHPTVRVCFHGLSHQRVVGSLNNRPVTAIVDTGADVNVITESYAICLGFETLPDDEATVLEFIDGSSVTVRGIVRNVAWRYGQTLQTGKHPLVDVQIVRSAKAPADWKFGTNASHSDTFICDFYVVEYLTVPLILSANMLFGTNAFVACNEYITQWNHRNVTGQGDLPEVAVVRKRGWLKEKLRIGRTSANGTQYCPLSQLIAHFIQRHKSVLPAPSFLPMTKRVGLWKKTRGLAACRPMNKTQRAG
ncbi:MAG: retroviral-like aspartic protease [Rhizobium sp.]|nr:retroviral-like aspartic protease [Rhizobium sp.]